MNIEILLDLVKKYGQKCELLGSAHSLNQVSPSHADLDLEANIKCEAETLYSKIDGYARTGRFDKLF